MYRNGVVFLLILSLLLFTGCSNKNQHNNKIVDVKYGNLLPKYDIVIGYESTCIDSLYYVNNITNMISVVPVIGKYISLCVSDKYNYNKITLRINNIHVATSDNSWVPYKTKDGKLYYVTTVEADDIERLNLMSEGARFEVLIGNKHIYDGVVDMTYPSIVNTKIEKGKNLNIAINNSHVPSESKVIVSFIKPPNKITKRSIIQSGNKSTYSISKSVLDLVEYDFVTVGVFSINFTENRRGFAYTSNNDFKILR